MPGPAFGLAAGTGVLVLVAPGSVAVLVGALVMLVLPGTVAPEPWMPCKRCAVSEPAAGGLGASTMPFTEGVVDGVGRLSSGTEWVVG